MADQDLEFMKLAISEARLSQSTRDTDPMVGAVVVSSEGRLVGSAHRGELAAGDHAEFTLLQKKIRSTDELSGGTLYTTLEPCTTRSHDKKPCARWIIDKGITRVVIGILDPNPIICGRGYWELIDNDVVVEFFPFHLASEVISLNEPFREDHRGGKDFSAAFSSLIESSKSPSANYIGFGWGEALALQRCPVPRVGWPLAQVTITIDPNNPFSIPKRHKSAYDKYYRGKYQKKEGISRDGKNFMLAKNPISLSDQPDIELKAVPTKFSQVQFYFDEISKLSHERRDLTNRLLNGDLRCRFAHSLCMHMVVTTSDNKALLTRRSQKVVYHPGTWSVSAEEQMSPSDLVTPDRASALNWGQRLLKEELDLDRDAYHNDNLRLLSIYLETGILNIALCCYAELRCDAATLESIVRNAPAIDKSELDAVAFLDLDRSALLAELIRPRLQYHPTSEYRLLETFLMKYGPPSDQELERLNAI